MTTFPPAPPPLGEIGIIAKLEPPPPPPAASIVPVMVTEPLQLTRIRAPPPPPNEVSVAPSAPLDAPPTNDASNAGFITTIPPFAPAPSAPPAEMLPVARLPAFVAPPAPPPATLVLGWIIIGLSPDEYVPPPGPLTPVCALTSIVPSIE